MDEEEVIDNNNNYYNILPTFPINPFIFFTKLISLQADIISTCILSFTSPFFSISSFLSNYNTSTFRRRKDDAVSDTAAPRGGFLLGRIAAGLFAAAYVCVVLMLVAMVAAGVGVGLVRMWVEEPVYVKESLLFDYTDSHPTAVFSFRPPHKGILVSGGVPVGQTLYVSLLLLMPESDYNRELGIFQLTAEIISTRGDVIEKSSHPRMLHFRSWPIRLVRTFMMGMPLLLGITDETQTIAFPVLKHKEASHSRTEAIRITLIPRAGTSSLPQFYDAEILLKSRLPWAKALVYRWKWTFYVWTTIYIFIMLVMVLVFFLKPLIFPVIRTSLARNEDDSAADLVSREPLAKEREVSESLRRLQRSRNKRKAALLHGATPEPEPVGSSASSITITRGETCGNFEGSGDSESVCYRG